MIISGQNTLDDVKLQSANMSSEQNTLTQLREFFAEKVSFLLRHKTSTFMLASALVVGGNELNKNQENKHSTFNTEITQIQKSSNQEKESLEAIKNRLKSDHTKLGSVYFDGQDYIVDINENGIHAQAEKYQLDYEILRKYTEVNETSTFNFVHYLPQSEYENQQNKYTYTQLLEAIQDLYSLEYLIEQQSISDLDKKEAQRIFNEKLRSKHKVKFLGSNIVKKSDKYDLVLAAAAYNYQFVFGEKFSEDLETQADNQKAMVSVTQRIDRGEYDENTLIMYAQEFRKFIEIETGVNIDDYKTYVAGIQNTEFIAQNKAKKRENY